MYWGIASLIWTVHTIIVNFGNHHFIWLEILCFSFLILYQFSHIVTVFWSLRHSTIYIFVDQQVKILELVILVMGVGGKKPSPTKRQQTECGRYNLI